MGLSCPKYFGLFTVPYWSYWDYMPWSLQTKLILYNRNLFVMWDEHHHALCLWSRRNSLFLDGGSLLWAYRRLLFQTNLSSVLISPSGVFLTHNMAISVLHPIFTFPQSRNAQLCDISHVAPHNTIYLFKFYMIPGNIARFINNGFRSRVSF